MANPWSQIETAVAAAAGQVTDVAWAREYNGESAEDMARHAAMSETSGVYVRVFGGGKDYNAGGVAADTFIEIKVVAVRLADLSAAARCKQLMWDVLVELQDSLCNLSWLQVGLQFQDWATEFEDELCCIVSLTEKTRFDLTEWV